MQPDIPGQPGDHDLGLTKYERLCPYELAREHDVAVYPLEDLLAASCPEESGELLRHGALRRVVGGAGYPREPVGSSSRTPFTCRVGVGRISRTRWRTCSWSTS